MDAKRFIREYIEARGGRDALAEAEKKALVGIARKKRKRVPVRIGAEVD